MVIEMDASFLPSITGLLSIVAVLPSHASVASIVCAGLMSWLQDCPQCVAQGTLSLARVSVCSSLLHTSAFVHPAVAMRSFIL